MNYKNVFVLCTGRCGSVTFARMADHITNATSGHETRSHCVGQERMAYATNHIEVDNRLSWVLGRLDQAFGRSAFYVHLIREPEAVARSFAARHDKGIMSAYSQHILMSGLRRNPSLSPLEFAQDYVTTVTGNIQNFLRDKPNKMIFRLERAKYETPWFWKAIGAEGDLSAACAEWEIVHNATSTVSA